MVRKGWTQVDVPNGWVQLIRGPRPRAAQWPRAPQFSEKQQRQQPGGQPPRGAKEPQPERVPLHPDERMARARVRVGQLESALKAPRPFRPHCDLSSRSIEEGTVPGQGATNRIPSQSGGGVFGQEEEEVVRSGGGCCGSDCKARPFPIRSQRGRAEFGQVARGAAEVPASFRPVAILAQASHFSCVSFASSSDVAVHTAQRIDGDGDSQWVVPGDPRSETTCRSLAECEVASVWVREAESYPTTGQVASGAHESQIRGGVGECQEARFRIGGSISAMIANGIDERSSEVTSLKDSLAKAKRNAQEPSASIQLKGAKEFVERARKRLVAHDAQRAVLEKELVDGETRVQRLEVEASVVRPRSTELDADVSQLKAKLAMMEAGQQRLREGAARSLMQSGVLQEFLLCFSMQRKSSSG